MEWIKMSWLEAERKTFARYAKADAQLASLFHYTLRGHRAPSSVGLPPAQARELGKALSFMDDYGAGRSARGFIMENYLGNIGCA